MVQMTSVIEAWGDVLHYPADGGCERAWKRVSEICDAEPELKEDLEPMLDYAGSHSDAELEEVFTKTFDSNAERALEVGWHLHGENYARGAFMVRMRQLLRDHGVPESSELPDHLSHVLPVIARAEQALAKALVQGIVVPALEKISEGFPSPANPYFGVLNSLRKFLEREYADTGEGSENE